MNHYQIRFNTQACGSPLCWRVFENNIETLVEHVRITVPVYDECSKDENGVLKYNIACDGYMKIEDGIAYIFGV